MGDANDEDRISKLPNGVIHHMMSFLPTKDVVRTCLLSKRWKLIWYSVPALSFSDHIEVEGRQEFYNYIEKYLEHRKRGMYYIVDSVITSFKLNMLNYWHCKCEKSKADDILDKWLAFIVLNKVEEIYLSIWPKQHWIFEESYYYFCYYCLPKIWFENATYLTVLELEYVELDASCSFSFPSLKILSLKEIHHSNTAEDDVVFKFLLGCPSLEKLWLLDYEFLCIDNKPQLLLSLSLKFFESFFSV
ncbi:putative F-box/LRR-repeat protein At5g41840 [Cannabis sativa]|uniref:putative F-box/LRR-repeat protein At5g41840 n=1 Tax=Cannabis sativa TaxID=3483 RepID=UPI0029C9ED82|nr:putative F-box/LRR-repeat protein At5g41840 [Cannabis sativa]